MQQAAVLALGHCKQEYVGVLLEEMQSLGEDSTDRAKAWNMSLLWRLESMTAMWQVSSGRHVKTHVTPMNTQHSLSFL